MELRQLGTSGLKVSALSLGAMTFGESQTLMKGVTSSDEEARRIFDRAIEAGINLVDTANVYNEGRSEELTGQWARGKREQILIASKCFFPVGFGTLGKVGPHDRGLSRRHILSACEASLRRLGTDYIDLYQVHMQDTAVRIDETLGALDDLVRQGKIRYAGCSNYTGYRLVESLWSADRNRTARYEAVQLQWSLLHRGAEREVIPACKQFGLGVLVWSPLASGFLSGKYRRGAPAPTGSRLEAWKDTFNRLGVERSYDLIDQLDAIAKKHQATCASVALAWLLARREVSSIILGARTMEQLEDNLKATEITLDADDLQALNKASQPDWSYPYDFIGRVNGGW